MQWLVCCAYVPLSAHAQSILTIRVWIGLSRGLRNNRLNENYARRFELYAFFIYFIFISFSMTANSISFSISADGHDVQAPHEKGERGLSRKAAHVDANQHHMIELERRDRMRPLLMPDQRPRSRQDAQLHKGAFQQQKHFE